MFRPTTRQSFVVLNASLVRSANIHSLPNESFQEIFKLLRNAEDKAGMAKKLMPQVRADINRGLKLRQIYKILHPFAMVPKANLVLKAEIKDMWECSIRRSRFGPTPTDNFLQYLCAYGSGFYSFED